MAGWIVEVSDGDGLLVDVPGRGRFKVRLAYVDAPEYDQPGGREAKDALRVLAFTSRSRVALRAVNEDRYGRTVAVVKSGNRTLNEEMVRSGHAWVDSRYVSGATRRRYKALENEARRKRRGLWHTVGRPIAPWDWRRREPTQVVPTPSLKRADRRIRRRAHSLAWIVSIFVVVVVVTVGQCAREVEEKAEMSRGRSIESGPGKASDRAPIRLGHGEAALGGEPHQIRDIQRMLKKLGYEPGPIDGILGPRTREAIRAFETESGLQLTGEATEDMFARLREEFER